MKSRSRASAPLARQSHARPRRRTTAKALGSLLESLRAVTAGDFSVRLSPEAQPVAMEDLAHAFNDLVGMNQRMRDELVRVEHMVGREGQMTERASLGLVSGGWASGIGSINSLIAYLVQPTTEVARVLDAVARGDLTQKMALDWPGQSMKGEFWRIGTTVNAMVDQLSSFSAEVTRVAREVSTEGKLGGQARVTGVAGTWKDLTDSVNQLANNITAQVRNIAEVTTSVARGDLSRKITVDARGEVLELKNTVNTMVDQLRSFAGEVTRVAKEVGTDGKLGGQANVPGVSGVWEDLTDNVNLMATNLTTQVRGIVKVVTAVANGDLSQRLVVDAKGEVAALADTLNSMTKTLGIFADQVTSVAKTVGVEGKLGAQADVPGVSGTWKDLTDNVNQLAGNLTTQVRAISEVATAVTKGDLTRSIWVDAQGEVASLKDNINQMIVNLKETTQKNTEQDWLKTNLARFSGMMQGQKNLEAVSRLIMSELTPLVSAHHGAFFLMDVEEGAPVAKLTSSYAYRERKTVANRFRLGESLVGQCALEKKALLLTDVPGDYIRITSGLGEASPLNILVLPVLFEGAVKAVIELASFHPFSTIHQIFLDQLMESIGVVLNMIMANMRTEELLRQSQSLANELQSQSRELTQQQQELRRSNSALETQALELEEKATLLEQQNVKVEEKNREVEQARLSLEEKAEQLSLISKYKSEFLANMSHELRTPLNSMLVLAELLADNPDGRLGSKQVEYAETIHSSGADLLSLINEILDLSKVEAGKMQAEPLDVTVLELVDFARRTFDPVAEQKHLGLLTEVSPEVPATLFTDPKRLQQILKNLLSNAFKFTSAGQVMLRVRRADAEDRFSAPELVEAEQVLAFSVIDTGIGIPEDKQKLIFEAFQQADGTTSRKYGGTGLGLSISRELARLLGGEIRVKSARGAGSTFTLFLPRSHDGSERGGDAPALLVPAPLMDPRTRNIPGEGVLAERGHFSRRVGERSRALGEEQEERARALAGRHVLLVDDDARNIFALTSVLENHGMHVTFAQDGRAAMELLETGPRLDVVLLDVMMPEMDGYQTARAIRADPRWASLPVIAITARALKDDREKCLEAGASDYLSKPVDTERLLELLYRWVTPSGGP